MGRRSHSRALSIWINGQRVGNWRIPTRGEVELVYDDAWIASPLSRPLSLSLPLAKDAGTHKGPKVTNFFDNLLPDSVEIRRRLASRFNSASLEAFDLLEAIGRDCVGAVQLLPEDGKPAGFDRIEGTALSDEEVAGHLRRAATASAFGLDDGDEDFRISLAGAQEKSALLRYKGRWMRPQGSTPTSHILKLPIGLVGNRKADLTTSVENEWLCMNILRAYGMPVAECEMLNFAGVRVLAVQRFDRQMHSSGKWLMRLPQEDFCQALSVPVTQKYEAEGGPGMQDLARVLQSSVNARADLETLITSQILFWMLAATDGHAKNFSIHWLAGGTYRLTPLYDVMSIWPIIGDGPNQISWHKAKLAMAVAGKNRHYLVKDIQRRHFNAMALRCGYGRDAEALIERLVADTPGVIEAMQAKLPKGFPARVAEAILKGLEQSAIRLLAMPAD